MNPGRGLHIHIGHHFFGAGNLGDDLMVAGFLRAVEQFMPGVRLTCCCAHDLESQRLRFPAVEWLAYERALRERCIEECDVWLGLGDSPFQTEVGAWLLDHLVEDLAICRRYSRPAFFLGVGVNDARALSMPQTQAIVKATRHIWARDRNSAAALANLCGWQRVSAGADLAHIYLRQYPFGEIADGALAFALNFENPEAFSEQALREVLDATPDWRHVWLAQEVRRLPGAEMQIFDSLPPAYQGRLDLRVPNYAQASCEALLAAWGSPAVIVTSRYHGALAGAWMGSRVLAVARNAKVGGAVSQLGLSTVSSFAAAGPVLEGIQSSGRAARTTLNALADLADLCCRSFFQACHSLERNRRWNGSLAGRALAKVGSGFWKARARD
jgi:polysaccharide pyruvyl transferase WcaK-like protein